MQRLRICRVGDELAVVLPDDWLRDAGVGEGDGIAARFSGGEVVLMNAEACHRWMLACARECVDDYHKALAGPAK